MAFGAVPFNKFTCAGYTDINLIYPHENDQTRYSKNNQLVAHWVYKTRTGAVDDPNEHPFGLWSPINPTTYKSTHNILYIYMYSTHISLTFNSNIIQYIYIIYNSCYKIVLWSPHLCKFNNNTAGHNNLADLVQPSQEPLDTHPHCSCSGNRSHWSGTSAVMFFALQSWEVKQRK
jgi:hypothetical protein